MALFGVLIVADMKCSCLSILLVYATQRSTNCVALAILIGDQLVNDIRGNACVHICSVAQQCSGTELHFRLKSAIQFWLDRESSYKQENGTVLRCPCVCGYF